MSALERILCVEDDPDLLEVIRLALERVGGFTVKLCASGREALAHMAGFHPDLVLLDVMMPGLDGPQTLSALRNQPEGGAMPVIFMTAKVRPDEVAHLISLGALAVITKPFDPMTLAQELRGHWRRLHDG